MKKESKYYLWDWSEIESEGARFENMIASHLLKFCDFYRFIFGIKAKLWYIRDRQGREVDFLVTWGETPWFMVECKLRRGPTGPLGYFGQRLDIAQRFLVTLDESHHYLDKKTGVHISPASRFLMALI
jgi:predicted AAA+ superfamily ATPase